MSVDCVIVGSGIAGLSVALELPSHLNVLVLTKAWASLGSTSWAQGGIAAVTSIEDSVDKHVQDTLIAGAGLCREDRVRLMSQESHEAILWLHKNQTRFRKEGADFHRVLEGGHSIARILNAKDATGRAITTALLKEARLRPNIQIREWTQVLELCLAPDGGISGVVALDRRTGRTEQIASGQVVLATGGAGRLFKHTTNPVASIGDGVALALAAGAEVEDMEFMQFHPTGLALPAGGRTFLITEAARGHGGILKNHLGEAFMASEHIHRDLAPRDVVARGIDRQLKLHDLDHVFLDLTHLDSHSLVEHFPNIHRFCMSRGFDMRSEPLPVVPSAHYHCGGVVVDDWARSRLPGLYVVGEAACAGIHGANRLASNSLLEGVVFGLRAAKIIAESLRSTALVPSQAMSEVQLGRRAESRIHALRAMMWKNVGIVRSDRRLHKAQNILSEWSEDLAQLKQGDLSQRNYANMLVVARCVVAAALDRKESRGLHFSSDYPELLEQATHSRWAWQNGAPVRRKSVL